MARTSAIEWTDATWNPITGCSIKSSGCTNCYAMQLAGTRLKHHPSREGLTRQLPSGRHVWTGEVRFNEQWINQPLSWKKPSMIFVCAHGDLFHEDVPDEWIDRVFRVMRSCPQHIFQVLTKRSNRMLNYSLCQQSTDYEYGQWPLPNVWFGVSIEDQATYDERVMDLAVTPAAVRFISAEPLLGEVDMGLMGILPSDIAPNYTPLHQRIHQVIAGGESGSNARPSHPDWFRSLRDQCVEAGVPFFFKQWGEYFTSAFLMSTGESVFRQYRDIRQWINKPNWINGGICLDRTGKQLHCGGDFYAAVYPVTIMHRVGKKEAGRTLDGRTWDEMPTSR